jgi:hypothetical protein
MRINSAVVCIQTASNSEPKLVMADDGNGDGDDANG